VKIAICVPCYGDTKAKFTQSLACLLIHTLTTKLLDEKGEKIPVEADIFMMSTSMLTQSRHALVAEALFWGADFLLWLDADHVFPPDTFVRLWARNKPVVGCNYARRDSPTAPTAAKSIDGGNNALVYTTEEKAQANELEEVSHLGFGVCLIDMRVFDALQAKAEENGETSFLPLFHFEVKGSTVIGEDVFFFKKIRDAGLKVYVDHGVSWEIGHIHENILMNAHANVQKGRWQARTDAARKRFEDRAQELEAAE